MKRITATTLAALALHGTTSQAASQISPQPPKIQIKISPEIQGKVTNIAGINAVDFYRAIAFGDGPLAAELLKSNANALLTSRVRNDHELQWARTIQYASIDDIRKNDPAFFEKLTLMLINPRPQNLIDAVNFIRDNSVPSVKRVISSEDFKNEFQTKFGATLRDPGIAAATVTVHEDIAIEAEVVVVVVVAAAVAVVAMALEGPKIDIRPDLNTLRGEQLIQDIGGYVKQHREIVKPSRILTVPNFQNSGLN